jgi:hypothetical protein
MLHILYFFHFLTLDEHLKAVTPSTAGGASAASLFAVLSR